MSKSRKAVSGTRSVLGLALTGEALHAVLLHGGDDGAEAVAHFTRQRVAALQFATADALPTSSPGLKTGAADYMLEVGDGSPVAGGLKQFDVGTGTAGRRGAPAEPGRPGAAAAAPLAPQLREILHECHTLGYTDPVVAFCLAPPDVAYVELNQPETPGGKKTDERKLLVEALRGELPDAAEERAVFVPMTPARGRERVLAVAALPGNPAIASLQALEHEASLLTPSARVVDAEAPVFTAFMQRAKLAVEGQRVALVRVGTEDSAVFFWEGDRLVHADRLRSVSAYDPPETVCSRVLLQQDEKRIRDLNTLVLVTSGRMDPLVEAFRRHYPDTAVEPIDEVLAGVGVQLEDEGEAIRAAPATALCVALRWLDLDPATKTANLMPPPARQRSRRLSVPWHLVAAVLLLVGMTAFSVQRYHEKATEIAEVRQEHLRNPIPRPLQNPATLQARVDSLETMHRTYTRALVVLDSLLLGSDRWVSTMERLSRATAATPRTWIDTVTPKTATTLTVTGRSLTRLAIVEMSRRLNGAIQQLTYQDVGQQRVYYFEMLVPAPLEMPRAAIYLRSVESDAAPSGRVEIHPARQVH
jgi:hypothetical protein